MKAVELCQRGLSNEQIAKELGVSTQRVGKYLNHYLEVDSKFPVGIDASKIDLMRAEQREHLEGFQRRLLKRAEKIQEISAYSPDEACALAAATAKLSDSFVKVSERIASMYGLEAPKPVAPPAHVTNNNMVIMSSQLVERIKLRRAEQLNGAVEALASPVQAFSEAETANLSGADQSRA